MSSQITVTMELTEEVTRAGSRNQTGFVNNLNRHGFTADKCVSEVLSNSVDACADNIIVNIKSQSIDIMDDGIGMPREKLINMFDANRENHANDKSIGVSGFGGIASSYILSKDDSKNYNDVIVYTRSANSDYLKAIVPWGEIAETKIYDEKIQILNMNEQEIDVFNADRRDLVNKTGTTIQYPISTDLLNVLSTHFVKVQSDPLKLSDWYAFIFGKTKARIALKRPGQALIDLPKYNYFGGLETEYHLGILSIDIHCFIDDYNRQRFMADINDPVNNVNHFVEYAPIGNDKYQQTKPTFYTREIAERILNGKSDIIMYKGGIRKDPTMFDIENPIAPSATFNLSEYDSQFMKTDGKRDVVKEHIAKTKVFRNNAMFTSYQIEGYKASDSRANGTKMVKNIWHQTEIVYTTASTQDNNLDNIWGVQMNKNQNQNNIPIPLSRLLSYLKEYDSEQRHCNYFNNVINEAVARKEAEKARAERQAEEKLIAQRLLEQQQQLAEIESSSSDEDDNSQTSITADEGSSDDEDDDNEPEIVSLVPQVLEPQVSEKEDNNSHQQIEESKDFTKRAAQALFDHISSPDYAGINGKEIYDLVIEFISRK